jgi:ABC-type uncharacterized transport system substrate-binding protein
MKKLLSAVLFCLPLLSASTAFAHGFHYQITVDTALKTDPQGHLVGLEMHWRHDLDVSKAMFEDEDMSPANRAQTLHQIGERLVNDLRSRGYYTDMKLKGKPLTAAQVKDYTLSVNSDQSMQLDFLLPLASPVALQGKTFTWSMVDPEGAGNLRYSDASHLPQGQNLPANCQLKLSELPPAPAASPDAAQASQMVSLTCPASN